MANIKTRLKLRYDSLEHWASENPTLLAGEVAIAYLPPRGTGDAPAATSTAVLMKVGPGAFNSLPFTSALAADVYAWAKEASLTINKDGTGKYFAVGTVMTFTYTIEKGKDQISILFTGEDTPMEAKYSIKGNKLTIDDSLGKDTVYIRYNQKESKK